MKLPHLAIARAGLLTVAGLALLSSAHAESPMHTDDASTLAPGGMKVEAIWSKDERARGGELLFGFSPIKNLELEVGAARVIDGSANPDSHLGLVALGAKWVPIQNETGWSLGARLDVGQTRIHDYETPRHFSERELAVTGLATYRFANGQALHLNLGAARNQAPEQRDTLGLWAVGYEVPVIEDLTLTIETFGMQKSRPDQAVGLRYEIFEGFKLSGAIGRGQDRGFGLVGVAWEF